MTRRELKLLSTAHGVHYATPAGFPLGLQEQALRSLSGDAPVPDIPLRAVWRIREVIGLDGAVYYHEVHAGEIWHVYDGVVGVPE